MDKKIKFAVIGCGHIGKRHAEMIERLEGAELSALCDIKQKEGLGIDHFNVPFFDDNRHASPFNSRSNRHRPHQFVGQRAAVSHGAAYCPRSA